MSIPGRDEPLYPDLSFFAGDDLFFHELHTGSEPESRYSSPDLSNLKGKYEAYQAYALAKRCRAQFAVSGFRVLTAITGGAIMLENVCMTAHSVVGDHGANRFLAIRLGELLDADPFAVEWRNAMGRTVRLAI